MLSGRRAIVIVWWAIAGLDVPHWPFVSPWTVTLAILGLEPLRSLLLELCCTAVFPLICPQLRKGPFWRTVLGYYYDVGKRGWGIEGYWCLRKWVQWSPSIGGAQCDLIASNERDVQGFLCLHQLLARSLPRRRSRRACVRAYVHLYVCVYICVYVYVCGHVYVYTYACVYVYVYVYVCVYTHVYVYVYAYLCIDRGSQYQWFSVWTRSCMRTCVRVHMYAYAYMCKLYVHFLQWVLHALWDKCFEH